jgi:DNA-binding NarL/FixJ family response regulator
MDNAFLDRPDKARILIVDAERSVAEAFGYYLEQKARFAVRIASDAVEARREINASGGFELMLLDIAAPGLERADAIERLAGLNGTGRTVTITGNRMTPEQPSTGTAGDVGLLYKSQPAAEIIDALSNALDSGLGAERR